MNKELKQVKLVFESLSKGEVGLNLDGLQQALQELNVSMTKDEVIELFGFIDLDGSLKIEIKEFLVALTIGMVLEVIPALTSETSTSLSNNEIALSRNILYQRNTELKEMLNLIVSAYLLFDPEGKGYISKDSVERLLEESGHVAGKNAMLSQDKWKEMVSFILFCIFRFYLM